MFCSVAEIFQGHRALFALHASIYDLLRRNPLHSHDPANIALTRYEQFVLALASMIQRVSEREATPPQILAEATGPTETFLTWGEFVNGSHLRVRVSRSATLIISIPKLFGIGDREKGNKVVECIFRSAYRPELHSTEDILSLEGKKLMEEI
jgi:hypothetical protein